MDWVVVFGMLQSVLEIIRNFFSCVLFYGCLCDVPPHLYKTQNAPLLQLSDAEGYNILRRKFGEDSFWVNGPYHAIMKAITGATGPIEGSYFDINSYFGGGSGTSGFLPGSPTSETSTVLNAMQAPTPQSLVAGSALAPATDPHMAQHMLHVQTAMPIMASGQFTFHSKNHSFFRPKSLPPKHASRFQNLLSLDKFHPFYSYVIFKYLSLPSSVNE